MGFTVAAALKTLPDDGWVEVVELIPAVIAWNRELLAPVAGRPLDDPRVRVITGDVARALWTGRGAYDAILLDVDNGPEGLTRRANDRLYSSSGQSAAFAALHPGGVLAVWSATPDRPFAERLGGAGFITEESRVRPRQARSGARNTIWISVRPTELPDPI
jgi:spermidine synthase